MDLEREIRRVLKKHQPRFNDRGQLVGCTCPSVLPAALDPMEKHQAKKIVQMLNQHGISG